MNRSRINSAPRAGHKVLAMHPIPLAAAIAAVLAGAPATYAADTGGGLEEVVVTAQKKSENMQDVPVSIVAFGSEQLDELHIQSLDDYVKYLPSVAFSRGDGQGSNGQPGGSHVYMRGIVSGPNENHSGSQPSVGTYLDEQPVTTIDGTVDVHIYDIARVEVLEGPQGTLYGASSQAGTVRIITNKPDTTKFSAGYDFSANQVKHGGIGYAAEGFINVPLSPVAAIRLVAWDEHTAGFINNVAGTNAAAGIQNGQRYYTTWCGFNNPNVTPSNATCPVGSGSISNAAYVKDKYNTAETKGGRAALKLNLGENWTVTPTVMGQSVTSEGFFGYDPKVGDLQVAHFAPENSTDSWVQTALTVEGKVGNFDLVYAGAYMKRNTHVIADYSDYSFFYDSGSYTYGKYWLGNHNLQKNAQGVVTGGEPIMPQQIVITKGAFEKFSHEFRVSTPQDQPVKATFGLFFERQLHNIFEQYAIPGYGYSGIRNYNLPNQPNGLADYLSIPTLNNTSWLTDEQRVDRDKAAFAQVTWDISSALSATVGYRAFKTDNSLDGFYGYSANYENALLRDNGDGTFAPLGGPGMNHCINNSKPVSGDPCMNLNKRVAETGHVPRYNVTYKFAPDKMIYATASQGFRPGGVNRNGDLGPYKADFLKNYEIGWKTQWLNHHLRWNASVFWEDWNDFQFSFLGQYSLTIINNGGSARIKGFENSLEWAVGNGLTMSLNTQFLDARTASNYCGYTVPLANENGVANPTAGATVTTADCTYPGEVFTATVKPFAPKAPTGTNMPISPKFKGNAVARYAFSFGDGWDGNVQAAGVYQTKTAPALKTADAAFIGYQPAYALLDVSGGVEKNGLSVEMFINNLADKRAEVSRFVQCGGCQQVYVIPMPPRTVGVKFGQKF